MSIKDVLSKVGIDPALAWTLFLAFIAAVVWLTSLQSAVAQNTKRIEGIEEIRQDVKWIKKRLGGPD